MYNTVQLSIRGNVATYMQDDHHTKYVINPLETNNRIR